MAAKTRPGPKMAKANVKGGKSGNKLATGKGETPVGSKIGSDDFKLGKTTAKGGSRRRSDSHKNSANKSSKKRSGTGPGKTAAQSFGSASGTKRRGPSGNKNKGANNKQNGNRK